MVKATKITKNYSKLQVLKGVNLEVGKGEIVSILGSSGAGKSTLLHILGTLDNPDKGELFINDKELSNLSNKNLSAFRNKNIGFVFQFHHLLPEFTALENVCIPAWILDKENKKEIKKRAEALLDQIGLAERLHHKPGKLSGGEQQRVAVARALINQPYVILADEPTGNLDSTNAKELHQLFLYLREQFQQTFIIATHNEMLAGMSDRQLKMKDGVLMN
ncbi:MAG TPA: ABC transporter ATP-binding protein [Chitinophagaceae bacterium]|nr:ABC transporter ATP-binding protein [Chitinophagaceae bacterium]